MPADFDAGQFPLKSCQLMVVEGLIFICLRTGQAPSLDEVASGLAPFLQLQGVAEAEIAKREVFSVKANWKLTVENYLECYHCKPAHKEYSRIEIKAEKIGDGSPAAMRAWRERKIEWRKLASSLGTYPEDFSSTSAETNIAKIQSAAAYRAPLRADFQTGSEDGKPVAPLMGQFSEYDGGETALAVGPFTYMLAYNDYAVFFQFVPVDAEHSDIIVNWLVKPGASSAAEFDLKRLIWLWRVTTIQDKRIIEDNAKGINSQAYQPGPVSLLEGDVAGFREWYLAIVGGGKQVPKQPDKGARRYFG
jgi:phenylpropionate dioxygenase-like ring-hydroxylating dioxygenase large terminal subunit